MSTDVPAGASRWEPVRAMSAEGARVGFSACRLCGAALLLDPDASQNMMDLHDRWHDRRMETP